MIILLIKRAVYTEMSRMPLELFRTNRIPEPAGIKASLKGAFPEPNFFQPPE